jgi:hypothetical protein
LIPTLFANHAAIALSRAAMDAATVSTDLAAPSGVLAISAEHAHVVIGRLQLPARITQKAKYVEAKHCCSNLSNKS